MAAPADDRHGPDGPGGPAEPAPRGAAEPAPRGSAGPAPRGAAEPASRGPAGPGRRKSADERREEILAVAIEHFAAAGYRGTSTEAIAHGAGISQPYLFRLFRTKRQLFLTCCDRACAKVLDAFRRAAAAAPPGEELPAMGRAYMQELLPDRHAILMLMQGYAASADREIQAHVRRNFRSVIAEVTRLSDAPPDQVWTFTANGMLLNVVAALELDEVAGRVPWAPDPDRPTPGARDC